ncbi:metallophosphoesterase [soil metagenome]
MAARHAALGLNDVTGLQGNRLAIYTGGMEKITQAMESQTVYDHPIDSRRRFLRRMSRLAIGAAGVLGASTAYAYWEASRICIRPKTIALPRLPRAFEGKTVAILTDFHHGPNVGLGFIRKAARMASSLKPDIIVLLGDFANKSIHTSEQLPPCMEVVAGLEAPLGVYAIPGNHDMQDAGAVYTQTIRTTPLTDLTNRSVRLSVAGEHLHLAGVDEMWWGKPDQQAALKDCPDGAAVILLSHNPDFAEENPNPRVDLVLSGHTHGGQICLPLVGPLWLPSRYGLKYRAGLVQGPASQVFISCGIGVAGVPLRFNCPPEINLLTLTRAE